MQKKLKGLKLNVSLMAFIQAAIVIILTAVNGVYSGVTTCFGADKTDCTTNSVLAIVLVILAVIWFGFLSAMAYAVWIRQTTILTGLFIILEIITTSVSAFDLIHHNNLLGSITSLVDMLAGLLVLLSVFLMLGQRGATPPKTTGRRRSVLNKKPVKK